MLRVAPCPSTSPELPRRDARAFRHRRHLRPYDIRVDRGLSDPGAEAAIASRHHVLAPDELRVAADALRNQLRMLDEVRFRFDDADDQRLVRGELDLFEKRPFMRAAGIGGFNWGG